MDSLKNTIPPSINPLLMASACLGSSGALNFLFNREDAKVPPMMMPSKAFLYLLHTASSSTSRISMPQQSSNDVEDGVDHVPALPTASLLEGVSSKGDTALHVVATHGESTEFLECAKIIFKRDQDLLFVVNKKGDTPFHCAAAAGKSQMVSLLIELAGSCNRTHKLLRKENVLKETALHEAVRIGNKNIVKLLLEADPLLANYPEQGTSPLYLAVLQGKDISIAQMLYGMSNGNLSYNGSNGKNALHAATFQGIGVTNLMLTWNNSLTTHVDRDGNTPLHLASSFKYSIVFKQLFEANPAAVYQADNKGFFPIHVAASEGVKGIIRIILDMYPSSAGLRTAQGRTFLHVAVEKRSLDIVSFVCRTVSLAWILNMQDNDGNTAMHLAVQTGDLRLFCSLYKNKEVLLGLANNSEETPHELAYTLIPHGMYYNWNDENLIYSALRYFRTNNKSCLRWDQYNEKYNRQLRPEDQDKEVDKVKDSSQILGIGSVLIATVAFGATFAVPGGFVADDHTNQGTPTLAGRYTFDAFMMANALALLCSSIATIGLMFSGTSLINLKSRKSHLGTSLFFMSSSVTCMSAAFALGVYMVLAPVDRATSIAICMLSPCLMLYRKYEDMQKLCILASPRCHRMGPISATIWILVMVIVSMVMELWPFIFIFGWASIAQKLRNH